MIYRYVFRCNGCNEKSIFRIAVPLAQTEDFICACPNCGVAFRGKLIIDYSVPSMAVVSDDFEILQEEQSLYDEQLKVVTIQTDLPVHRTRHVESLARGGSPFIWLTCQMGERFLEYKSRVDALHAFRQNFIPRLKRIVSYAETDNWEKVRDDLSSIDIVNGSSAREEHVIHLFYRVLDLPFVPLLPSARMLEILEDYYVHPRNCLQGNKTEYIGLLQAYVSGYNLKDFKARVLDVYCRAFDHFDAFIPGLVYEHLPASIQENIDEYRVYRNDFDIIKALYLDIFELLARMLFYVGGVVNLSVRNDPALYSKGKLSARRFCKMRASDRMFVLDELPVVKGFVAKVDRHLRNYIGHFNVRYDFREGVIIYEDGSKQNYIVFLKCILDAVRTIWFTLKVVERAEIDLNEGKV